LTRKTCLWQK
jgi:Outer membrane efflux protein